ncbi:MAG: hypothetical protein MAG715_01319 [Methanonatronarchaeales archaeon]|nr:hypothetical protein [Methanonatronarchaeales archaeon]
MGVTGASDHLEDFLRTDEMSVIAEISRIEADGGVPYAGEVASRLGIDPSLLSKRLDSYEERGLLDRSERLGNLKLLKLTDDGRVLASWFEEALAWVEYERDFDEAVS